MMFVNGSTLLTSPRVTGPAAREALIPPPFMIVKSAPLSAVIASQIREERLVFFVLTSALSPLRFIGILATTTPDNTFPSTAAKIQAKIKAFNSTAFDVQAVCSGFIYALTVADSFIKAGNAKTVLVIGAETMSRVIDWTDRSTCVLFGDGAGAVILQASNQDESSKPSGILSTIIKTDGRYYDALKTNSGPSMGNEKSYLQMSGKEVFKIATSKMPEVSLEAIKKANLSPSDVNWLVPHQANVRIIDAALKKISIPAENTAMTISEHANTSAASIPLAFDNFIKNNKIKHGDVILMTAMGAGFTWGSVVLRY